MTRPPRVSRLVQQLLAAALYFSGVVALFRRFGVRPPGLLILRYHSIGGAPCLRDPLVVSPRHFAGHVRYLHRTHAIVSMKDVIAFIGVGQPLPRGSVALTFDDGYRDNHDIALPILRHYCCPATVFVVVESARTGEPPWPQRLWESLRSASVPELRVAWEGARSGRRLDGRFDLRTPETRNATYRTIKLWAAELDDDDRAALLGWIAAANGKNGHARDSSSAMLDWDQVRGLARSDITIGSHTMTHPRVSSLDPERAAYELLQSRVTLESILGSEVSLFAYPFGTALDFDTATRQAVLKAGYRAACTTLEGRVGPDADLLALPRLKVRDEPVWMFAVRLLAAERRSGLLNWIARA
jgi:peptidoglycan/xylan/chitin deacetylase (PgdA/CDA1 family)